MKRLTSVLLVDDEASIRDGLKHMIHWEKEGFHLMGEAENGSAALELIKNYPPDIIITDLKMPKMDGIELTSIIQKQYPDIHFFILSSYDDFQYVSQAFKNGAVDYLLKPTINAQQLLSNLKRIQKKLQTTTANYSEKNILQESLGRYLSGYETEELTAISDYFTGTQFYLLYTNLQYYQSKEQLQQALLDVQQIAEINDALVFTASNQDTGLLLSTTKNIDLLPLLRQHLESLKYVEPEAFLTLSAPLKDLSQLKVTFTKLRDKSQEQLFFFKNQVVLQDTTLVHFSSTDRFDTKKFLKTLLNNDFLLGITRVESYFDEMILSNIAPSFLKQQASSIFYTLFSRIEEEFPTKSELRRLKMTFLREVGHVQYLENFSQLILETIESLRTMILEFMHPNENEQLLQIQQYIEEHYNEALSLTQLANHFHFSYNYLSTFLSENLTTSFSEYVKTLRLERAKQLLTETDMNLSEISESVGYSDLSYFSKLFKKEFQLAPSKYRRKKQAI
jgi:Response regulator containing CheY-like receiver domain and AraC-type DNA-binding domain